MKIAVTTLPGSAQDINSWSGTPAHFMRALRQVEGNSHEAVAVPPLRPMNYWTVNKFAGLTGRMGNKVNWEAEPAILRHFTRELDEHLDRINPDVTIAMGWTPLDSKHSRAMFYWNDATIAQRINLAPHWSKLSRRTEKQALIVERRVLSQYAGTFWATRWAESDAKTRYGLFDTEIVPFGANAEDPGLIQRMPLGNQISLLTVGVKWHRKGIDRAVRAVDVLVEQGHNVRLDVVGVRAPSDEWERTYVQYHGFLRKESEVEHRLLTQLYKKADIFLLPTRNEPFGIVFQEAASYGLPVVSANIGGVPEVVQNNRTGLLLGDEASHTDYAEAISRIVSTAGLHADLSRCARELYEGSFTWRARVGEVIEILERFRDGALST